MDPIKRPFYCDLYHKTGGFFPIFPESQTLLLGDFFQIRSGKCLPLGNIRDLEAPEPIVCGEPIALRSEDWRFRSGVRQCFRLTEEISGENGPIPPRSKQVFEFEEAGSYLFLGKNPQERSHLNWTAMKDELTLKMTQEAYSFREVCVVTGVVEVSSWGLILAERGQAQLTVSSEVTEPDFFQWFSDESSRIERSEHIQAVQQRQPTRPPFFKAKKLVLNEKKREFYTRKLYEKQTPPGNGRADSSSLANWLQTDLLNLVVADELNLSTALEFFDWTNMTLDDLENK